jgi:hypothetical protein
MPGARTDGSGYLHEAVLYDSDEEFLGVVVPFLQEGVAVGEPCLVALGASSTRLVRAAVGNTSGLTFLDDRYDRPASVIRSNRDLFAAHVADGASRIRVASEVPHPGVGAPWDGWARYEAAVNDGYAEFPLWGLCAYDTRITPASVLDDVARTHPHLATAQAAAEVIMLTHNRDLHEVNLGWHPKAEDTLWRPDLQQAKRSQTGMWNVRYRNTVKREGVQAVTDLIAAHAPWLRVRYSF